MAPSLHINDPRYTLRLHCDVAVTLAIRKGVLPTTGSLWRRSQVAFSILAVPSQTTEG